MGIWRHCSSCRADIGFDTVYWECSVSTCARVARTGLFFCSVGCWEAHLPTMRHREAWAVEKRSPGEAAWRREQAAEAAQRVAAPAPAAARPAPIRQPAPIRHAPSPTPVSSLRRPIAVAPRDQEEEDMSDDAAAVDEVLVVVSKLKKYIRAKSGMNTSDGVVSVLSDHLRHMCDLAVQKATEDGRKTVLDRDFKAATGQQP
jgi:hypothetical protein